ncbi:MAG TPA: MtrB/PioB family outer membrane beta-barrel protein, partial [Myxococcota bacterium]
DLAITLNVNWWNDQYDDSELGLTSAKHVSPGLDVAYMLNEWISTYAFYNYEKTVTDSAGWEYGNVQQSLDPTRRWWSKEKVNTHTAGAGVNLAIIRDRLELGVDYLFAQSKGAIDTVRNPGTTLPIPVPFPDLLERQHNVSVHADYHFTDNFSVRVGYLFQYLNTNDWALDGLTPTSLTCSGNACVIGVGQDSPHYTANVVSWSLVYTFW